MRLPSLPKCLSMQHSPQKYKSTYDATHSRNFRTAQGLRISATPKTKKCVVGLLHGCRHPACGFARITNTQQRPRSATAGRTAPLASNQPRKNNLAGGASNDSVEYNREVRENDCARLTSAPPQSHESERFDCKSRWKSADRVGQQLQGIELLACYSDGGAKQSASAKVAFTASAEARLTFARLAATHPVAIGGKFESYAAASFQQRDAAVLIAQNTQPANSLSPPSSPLRQPSAPQTPDRAAVEEYRTTTRLHRSI